MGLKRFETRFWREMLTICISCGDEAFPVSFAHPYYQQRSVITRRGIQLSQRKKTKKQKGNSAKDLAKQQAVM